MKTVKVILRQDIDKLGSAGEIVSVKPGFARNYLLPRGFAYEATQANLRELETERGRAEARSKRDYLEARRRAAQLEEISLTFHARAGEESKLFGSITTSDIAERLNGEGLVDFEVDRRSIELDEPIKSLGVFPVAIRLHADVKPEIKVWVIKAE
ncbi:MAG TPA: 50S ribosomal protein L9 [Longimicrobiales bacterium]|nr:50S ribosomal protein L9 [Longimicrobiales bacterium]